MPWACAAASISRTMAAAVIRLPASGVPACAGPGPAAGGEAARTLAVSV